MSAAAGRTLVADPMGGYLSNLDPDDYKNLLRPRLPEHVKGREFVDRYLATIDLLSTVDPGETYAVRQAADHHVLEARRISKFAAFIEQAGGLNGRERKLALDKAGHLMYASHLSYSNDALLGSPECDLLVQLVRQREAGGLYGAENYRQRQRRHGSRARRGRRGGGRGHSRGHRRVPKTIRSKGGTLHRHQSRRLARGNASGGRRWRRRKRPIIPPHSHKSGGRKNAESSYTGESTLGEGCAGGNP